MLSVIDKTAYFGGNVCAKVLSDPLQLGKVCTKVLSKTFMQEVHFSYHTQLSDRQELLRSSRNFNQKMTPRHKEHSRVFLTRNKLIYKPRCVGKKTHACTVWNSRIAKNLPELAEILVGKLHSNRPKTLRWPLFAGPYLTSTSSDSSESGTLQN